MKLIINFLTNEDGATAIEYGLIAGLIATAIVTAVSAIGSNLANKFNEIANNLT